MASVALLVCPKCGSDDVTVNVKRQRATCESCGYTSLLAVSKQAETENLKTVLGAWKRKSGEAQTQSEQTLATLLLEQRKRSSAILSEEGIYGLPDELWICIFSRLDVKSLCRASITCRWWHNLAEDNLLWKELWKELYLESWGGPSVPNICLHPHATPALTWKKLYRQMHSWKGERVMVRISYHNRSCSKVFQFSKAAWIGGLLKKISELARRLTVDRATLQRMLDTGMLPRVDGVDELEEYGAYQLWCRASSNASAPRWLMPAALLGHYIESTAEYDDGDNTPHDTPVAPSWLSGSLLEATAGDDVSTPVPSHILELEFRCRLRPLKFVCSINAVKTLKTILIDENWTVAVIRNAVLNKFDPQLRNPENYALVMPLNDCPAATHRSHVAGGHYHFHRDIGWYIVLDTTKRLHEQMVPTAVHTECNLFALVDKRELEADIDGEELQTAASPEKRRRRESKRKGKAKTVAGQPLTDENVDATEVSISPTAEKRRKSLSPTHSRKHGARSATM